MANWQILTRHIRYTRQYSHLTSCTLSSIPDANNKRGNKCYINDDAFLITLFSFSIFNRSIFFSKSVFTYSKQEFYQENVFKIVNFYLVKSIMSKILVPLTLICVQEFCFCLIYVHLFFMLMQIFILKKRTFILF